MQNVDILDHIFLAELPEFNMRNPMHPSNWTYKYQLVYDSYESLAELYHIWLESVENEQIYLTKREYRNCLNMLDILVHK